MSNGPPPAGDEFETVDWDDVDAGSRPTRWHVRAFVVGIGLLALGYGHEAGGPGFLPPDVTLTALDWLFAGSLLALVSFVVVPLAKNRQTTLRYWQRFRANRSGVASLLYVLAFFAVGLLGPLFVSQPTPRILHSYQPPVGLSIDTQFVTTCVGRVTSGRCHGTWQYPLGTTYTGKSVIPYVVYGARTTLQVALVSSVLLVPTGVAVGLVAAYADRRIDAVLMRSAEILQTVPVVLIYLILRPWITDHRLLLMIAVFGLASWGGLARLVRNEALRRREELYVRAAEGTGADRRWIVSRHLLPNVAGPVLTNATLQIPMLVLTEAALSFLELGDPTVFSWGQTISLGVRDWGVYPAWWITVAPALLLIGTVLAFNVLGDALNRTLDPRDR